jgi:hypothetical protein
VAARLHRAEEALLLSKSPEDVPPPSTPMPERGPLGHGSPASLVPDPCTGASAEPERSWRDWAIPSLAVAALMAWILGATIEARDPDADLAAGLFGVGALALVIAALFAAALPLILAALPALPGVAAIATVALTLTDVEPLGAVLAGAAIMVASALLLAALGRGIGQPARVNPRTYADLRRELDSQCAAHRGQRPPRRPLWE